MTYDVIIIGGGPAGLTAAIYTSRARLKTLLLESYNIPGQAVVTSDIENYPGFPEGINGFTLIDKLKKQAGKFGTEFKVADVESVKKGDKASTLRVAKQLRALGRHDYANALVNWVNND